MSNAQLSLVGDAVGAASGAVGSVISGIFQSRENRKNREFAQQQAQQARQWQIEQWNMENEYNNPTNQMQRYVDAGLNPNLIYGDVGAGLGASAPSVPQGDAVPGTAPQVALSANLNGMLQGRLMDAQIKRLETQNDNDTKMTEAQMIRFSYENSVSESEVKRAAADIEVAHARCDEIRQGIENMKQQWDILDEQKKQERFQTAFVEATQGMRIQAANAESEATVRTAVALAVAQLLNVKADTALKWSQAALAKANVSLAKSQERLNNANMAVARNQAQLIIEEIKSTKSNTELTMQKICRERSYNESIYGTDNDGWFWKSVHVVTSGIDATARCLGQILSL